MKTYPYIIIGGGMAADAAIQGIRRHDRNGAILVFSDEPFPPYQRPPLSKGLWLQTRMEQIWLNQWQRQSHIDFINATRVQRIDLSGKRVEDQHGNGWGYGRLLIATGGRARILSGSSEQVFYVGQLSEHIRLWRQLSDKRRVMVVGGGFIGAEMAAVLSQRGHEVTWIFPDAYPFEKMFPRDLADYVTGHYRRHGVRIQGGHRVDHFEAMNGVTAIRKDGDSLDSDVAVVGIGITPNDQIARDAGLKTESGIHVDQYLCTSDPHVYACGDVAVMPPLFRPMFHEDQALTQGRLAGENMAGAQKTYQHMPFFYSDLYHFGYEAIGEISTKLSIEEDWAVPGEEGVVYYLQEGRLKGVLNWNVWDGIPKARALISQDRTWTAGELKGQIRNE